MRCMRCSSLLAHVLAYSVIPSPFLSAQDMYDRNGLVQVQYCWFVSAHWALCQGEASRKCRKGKPSVYTLALAHLHGLCVVADKDPRGWNVSLQFIPCYVIAQHRPRSAWCCHSVVFPSFALPAGRTWTAVCHWSSRCTKCTTWVIVKHASVLHVFQFWICIQYKWLCVIPMHVNHSHSAWPCDLLQVHLYPRTCKCIFGSHQSS